MNKEFLQSSAYLIPLPLRMPSRIVLLFTIAAATALADKNVAMSSVDYFTSTSSENKNETILRKVRNVIPYTQNRWPSKTVPYAIDNSLARYKNLISAAIQNYHQTTCLKFVPRTSEPNYIRMFAGQGCYSNVGMIGGQQPVSLGEGCMYKGVIVQQLGLAIGLLLQQKSSDRDDYLTINWDNIEPGMESEFAKLDPSENLLLSPFDYNSVMLYGNLQFSRDGESLTMEAKDGTKLRETKDKLGLSNADVLAVNRMYKC